MRAGSNLAATGPRTSALARCEHPGRCARSNQPILLWPRPINRSQWTELWLRGVTFPVDFMIGVAGYDGAAEFSVVATSTQYVVLDSGMPQAGAASPIALTYFLFNVPPTSATGLEGGCAQAPDLVPALPSVQGGDELRWIALLLVRPSIEPLFPSTRSRLHACADAVDGRPTASPVRQHRQHDDAVVLPLRLAILQNDALRRARWCRRVQPVVVQRRGTGPARHRDRSHGRVL